MPRTELESHPLVHADQLKAHRLVKADTGNGYVDWSLPFYGANWLTKMGRR